MDNVTTDPHLSGEVEALINRLRANQRTQWVLIGKLPVGSLELEAARQAADALGDAARALEGGAVALPGRVGDIVMVPREALSRIRSGLGHPAYGCTGEQMRLREEIDAMFAASPTIPIPATAEVEELVKAASLTIMDAAYHLRKYRPHCLEELQKALRLHKSALATLPVQPDSEQPKA